jgi:hypothetical protein
MQTIENTTTIPAVRRVDEVVAKREAAAAFLAERINGLTRAEIGVLRSALSPGATPQCVSGAEYYDGYDPERYWFTGLTRRLSQSAREKALGSLYRAGLIRVEGISPMAVGETPYSKRGWNANRYCHVSPYTVGNSGIRLDNEGTAWEYGDGTESGVMTPQQIAGWYGAWLLGFAEKSPEMYLYWADLESVVISAAPELVEAFETVATCGKILAAATQVARSIDGLAGITVADRVKPDAIDIVNSVTTAYYENRNAGADVAAIYRAMEDALSEWRDDALYGSKPENSITPERYVARLAELTAEVEAINAKIEEVSR